MLGLRTLVSEAIHVYAGPQLFLCVLDRCRGAAGDNNLRTLCRKQLGGRQADATRSAVIIAILPSSPLIFVARSFY